MDEAHDREQHEETRGEAEFRASKHDRATPEAICPSRAATTMVDFRQLADQGWPHDEYRKYGTKAGPCNPDPRFRRSTRGMQWRRGRRARETAARRRADRRRSEEHTSELQSLMRISSAVFCLKKKKKDNHTSRNCKT